MRGFEKMLRDVLVMQFDMYGKLLQYKDVTAQSGKKYTEIQIAYTF